MEEKYRGDCIRVMKHMRRLQGKRFHDIKNQLMLVAYFESINHQICGYYKYPSSHMIKFCHWFNDEEKASFKKDVPCITIAEANAWRF